MPHQNPLPTISITYFISLSIGHAYPNNVIDCNPMLQSSTHPIGIFDSGMGGLTVAKTITEYMPNENIVYFGDTAHTP
ncbi:MAG TPA: hypothetical protein PK583_03940, partial [Gammaproteobacteria bacterium]|nr:hypothetical protein [Gammaproteobacteria bacterium]